MAYGQTPRPYDDIAAMHEVSIVEALIDQVQREMARAGAQGRVRRLELSIGRLSGVHSDAIRFAFELLAPGTPVEAAELVIEEPAAECVCRDCEARTPVEELVLECPGCGSAQVSLEGGQEMLLQTIDVDD